MTTTGPTCTRPATSPAYSAAGLFLEALTRQDFAALRGTLDEECRLQALVPVGLKEWEGADAVGRTFAGWFGDTRGFEVLEAVIGDIGARLQLRWRLRLRAGRLGEGWFVVEQHAYADTDPAGRITRLRLVCSGYCPEAVPTSWR